MCGFLFECLDTLDTFAKIFREFLFNKIYIYFFCKKFKFFKQNSFQTQSVNFLVKKNLKKYRDLLYITKFPKMQLKLDKNINKYKFFFNLMIIHLINIFHFKNSYK